MRLPWEQIKSKYKLGQFVQGKVEYHAPFGVFVDLGESSVKGLIRVPDFLDEGAMSEEMYPELGTSIGAIVVGYNESNGREVYLNAKPSVLQLQFEYLVEVLRDNKSLERAYRILRFVSVISRAAQFER